MLLFSLCVVSAIQVEQCSTENNKVIVKLNHVKSTPELAIEDVDSMITSQTFALPFLNASVNVVSSTWKVYDANGNFIKTHQTLAEDAVHISNSFTFREMYGFSVNIQYQVNENDKIKVLESIEYEVIGLNPISLPQSVSSTFIEAYKKLASNYDTSYLRNLPVDRPKMLIISHNSLNNYLPGFVSWKKSKGFDVYVANVQTIGNSVQAIKNYVLNHYLEYRSDHLLILGDVNGSYAIPTNIYTSPDGTEQDADDNFYTMLIGDDYFPEMVSGRFSFGDINEMLTMFSKTINYERNPYMINTNWMRRSLVVAGNYAEGGLRPVTPIWMSRWLREKMLAKGYAAVDTVFYPPTLTGASAITASINQGVQFISYRGWGAADGWHYPAFHNQDLNSSHINGARMPIVFSIVCNTGDFANSVNPCFGEKWMRMGTIEGLGGCVGFVGPSDLHTKTIFNNTISTGIFSGIFDDGIRNLGASVLAGKIELYNNYPHERGPNQHVAFYFHVYNILSDPSLNMWVLVPSIIPASVVTNGTAFAQSDSYIDIQAPGLDGAIVTGTKNNTDYTYAIVHNGSAVLPINPEQTGVLTVTISKENHVPRVVTMTPSLNASIGVVDNSLIGQLVYPGQNYSLNLTLKNYSESTLSNINASLSAIPTSLVTIQNSQQMIGSIAPGATTTLTYNVAINGNTPSDRIIRFDLNLPSLATQSSFELKTGGARFVVTSTQGNLNIGNTNTITFSLMNSGNYLIQNASVILLSSTNAAAVLGSDFNLGNVGVGETGSFQANISVQADCYNGRNIPLVFIISNTEGYETICYYNMTAGNPSVTDPTGPCGYGYFAYDSFDVSYPQHPTYEWIEIDPRDGGPQDAQVNLIMDDGSYTVNLPFTFRYYGVDYNSMTICSNGWVSFVTTWMADFNNNYIPAALGPYAMVAPYWDDLKGMKTGQDSLGSYFNDMRIVNWYDQANNRYIVEWNDAYNQFTIELMQNASLEKFQLILYPNDGSDGDIVVQYHTVDNPGIGRNYCTVGVENHLQNDGLTYTFSNQYPVTARPLQAGLAIRFTTSPPDSYVSNDNLVTAPVPFVLNQNYPNPFNPETTIDFSVNTKSEVKLEVYNLKGQRINTLLNSTLNKGNHQVNWNGTDDKGANVTSGVYIYKMTAEGFTQTKKMILMK